jgi:DNA-binding NarL/FixJ family response regulator
MIIRYEQQLLEELTPRETQILQGIAGGYSLQEVARALRISVKTADHHRSRVMDKLRVHDRVRLTRLAIRNGLVSAHDVVG